MVSIYKSRFIIYDTKGEHFYDHGRYKNKFFYKNVILSFVVWLALGDFQNIPLSTDSTENNLECFKQHGDYFKMLKLK